ncbi:MAG: hypothetical protein RLZZ415_1632 [Pseudomonadota bacterium]|jgi:hypothetical protein
MPQIILYTVLAILVALLGIGKRGGFLLHLVLSLLLTPITGIILVLLSPDCQKGGKAKCKSDKT